MKLVSPFQRGTMWACTCSGSPAPAVQVSDAAARGGAEIKPDVKAVGLEGGSDDFFAEGDEGHEVGGFVDRELFEIGDFSKWNREEVARIVGETVEHQVGQGGAVHDECRPIIPRSRKLGERTIGLRKPRRFDVFHPPVSMQLIHRLSGRSEKSRTLDVKARKCGDLLQKYGDYTGVGD